MDQSLSIFGGLSGIGVLAAGFGFAYSQFRSGGSKAKDELITTLKETAQVEHAKAVRLENEMQTLTQSHQTQLNELTIKIGKLQGLYEASEANKKEYLAILQGRDPKLQETLNEIRGFLKKLTEQANTNEHRNEQIDKDTRKQVGKFLRKKN